jgi:predicted RNA polymerase sigma factor
MSDRAEKEEAMRYMLLIHQGDTPLPGSAEWERLSEDEQKAVYADYKTINETPGVTPAEAREAYRRALALVHADAERRLLERRLAELGS